MSFSPITDALYTWMLKSLIKSHQDQFCWENDCVIDVDNINIIRSDDVLHNSHMVCESICSAIQGSDLIVVDFSYENPNVYYEFGLAVALGKKILPICYKGSYMASNPDAKGIARFPLKKRLFEYFSLNSQDFDGEFKKDFSTEDVYEGENLIPPTGCEKINESLKEALLHSLKVLDNLLIYDPQIPALRMQANIGQKINAFSKIVEKLTIGKSLLNSAKDNSAESDHRFLPQSNATLSAGLKRRGDRILLLYSDQPIITEDKDRADSKVPFNFGDIGRLAVNQANHDIERGKHFVEGSNQEQLASTPREEQLLWYNVYNCTMTQSMDSPLSAETVYAELFPELNFLSDSKSLDKALHSSKDWSFTYLDAIMAKAQNCFTALIDMRKNRIEALFWMGLFHGRGRFVIPIHYNDPEEEITQKARSGKPVRVVADILGLWNAYFYSDAPEKFCSGVEKVLNSSYEKDGHLKAVERSGLLQALHLWRNPATGELPDVDEKQEKSPADCEKSVANSLEKYYRRMFWNVMLAHSDVSLYPSAYHHLVEPKVSLWDYNGSSAIAQFVNQRSGIFRAVLEDTPKRQDTDDSQMNISLPRNNLITLGAEDVNQQTSKIRNCVIGLKDQVFTLHKKIMSIDEAENVKRGGGIAQTGELEKNEDKPKKDKVAMRGFVPGINIDQGKEWTEEFLSPQVDTLQNGKLYGQMIFLRIDRNHYFVLLEGASGPATYAMAKLLVDNDINSRKNNPADTEKDPLLFYNLQINMLKKHSESLQSKYKQQNGNSNNKMGEVFALTANYLMMCLCERFLPLTSQNFIEDLEARMHLYLKLLERDLNGEEYQDYFCQIREVLRKWFTDDFEQVCGASIILKSTFKTKGGEMDDREVTGIYYPEEDDPKTYLHIITCPKNNT